MDMEIKVRILFGSISLFAIWMNESICTNAMMSKKEWQSCWNYMLGPPDRDQVNKLLLMHDTIIFFIGNAALLGSKVHMLKKY